MTSHGYYQSIPDQVFEDIRFSEVVSIREDSLSELTQSLDQGRLELVINPEVTHYQLQSELSIPQQLTGELVRVIPLFVSTAIGAYSIHTLDFLWLLLILILPLVYFLRNFIILLVRFIVPVLLLVAALAAFVYWSPVTLFSAGTFLCGSLWVAGLNSYHSSSLLKKALRSEAKFIELYFKNVFLLFRGDRLLNSPEEVQGFIEYSYKHHPPKLTGKEMLYYCKRCHNRNYSQQKGIVCGLTGNKPNFENECPDFDHDPERAQYEDSILFTRLDWIAESEFTIKLVPYFLYGAFAIFFLSEVNFWYSGRFFAVFRSGLTDWLHLKEVYAPVYTYYGLIIPGLLLTTGILASTGKKWAFIAGFMVFFIDTFFTFISLNGTVSWWVHLGVLASLFAGIKEMDNVKAFTKSLIGNG